MPADKKLTVGSLFAGISEGLNSDSKGQDTSELYGKSKMTLTAKKSWQNIGLKSHDTRMLGKSVVWPTPRAGNPGSRITSKGGKILAQEVKNSLTQTSSAEDSPVRTSRMLGRELALKEKEADYGRKWRDWSVKYDPDTSSWKTSQRSLAGELIEFSETWPRSGMMRNGTASPLQPSAPIIRGIGSSLLPTPNTQEVESMNFEMTKTGRRNIKEGKGSRSLNLGRVVQIFPTHQNTDYITKRTSKFWKEKGRVNYSLYNPEIQKMWRTPSGTEGMRGIGTKSIEEKKSSNVQVRLSAQVKEKHGGQLNADWVERLMGFPAGWTVVDGSAESPESQKNKKTE